MKFCEVDVGEMAEPVCISHAGYRRESSMQLDRVTSNEGQRGAVRLNVYFYLRPTGTIHHRVLLAVAVQSCSGSVGTIGTFD